MTRRRAFGGLAAIVAFVALAALSGRLSPLARMPVLDGLGPLAPYRWVSPPPEAAGDNLEPQAGRWKLAIGPDGSEPDVAFTPDDQVTLILDRGAVAPSAERRSVEVRATPLDPDRLATLPDELAPFGNAIRIDVEGVDAFDGQVDVILLYPATITLHATQHEILWSPDGSRWERLDTADSIATQQAQATIARPGIVVVGAVPVPHPSASPSAPPTEGAENLPSTVAIVLVGCLVLLGAGLAVRVRARRGC